MTSWVCVEGLTDICFLGDHIEEQLTRGVSTPQWQFQKAQQEEELPPEPPCVLLQLCLLLQL